MKVKKLLLSLLLLILILVSISSPFMIKRGWALPSATRVYVDPATPIVLDPGGIFTVDIKIEGAEHVAGWQIELYYDSEILFTQQHPSDPTKQWVTVGDFLTSPFPLTASVAPGHVGAGTWSFSESSGSGTLASVKFEVIGTGRTLLDLRDTIIRDGLLDEGQPPEEDGEFHTTIPRAEFFYSTEDHPVTTPGVQPILNPVVNETVTFNATFFEKGAGQYKGSYDPDTMKPEDPDGEIASYAWDFGDGDTTTVVDPVITHAYDSTGPYTVNLTVTDNENKKDSFHRSLQVVIHDLAIIDIEVTPIYIRPGEEPYPTIDVTVLNKGTETEAGFNVTTYYDSSLIWYNQTENMAAYSSPLIWNEETTTWGIDIDPDENITITYTWNTTGLGEGTYDIWANVSRVQATDPSKFVPGETLLTDNEHHFGNVYLSKSFPVARFTFTPSNPRVGETVAFDATDSDDLDGYIVDYTWDFDDGTPIIIVDNTTTIVYHEFTKVGTYNVKLTVTDNASTPGERILPVTVSVHELNITTLSLPPTVTTGTIVSVYVGVKNEGGFDETFNVTAYYDTTFIDTEVDETRDAGKSGVTTITWNTTGVPLGTYTIRAEVSTVPHEINTTNNIKTTTITILTHDIAVTSINVSPTTAKIGESITINVTLTNEGSFTETFNVTTYHNGNIIETRTDISLDPGASTTETFTWNTAEASVGSYTIKAEAIIDTDLDIVDNTKTYETVTLEKATSTITIEISPTTVTVDGTVTINGTITPHREGVTVTINYKLSTEETWNTLSPVTTDENGQYTYEWTPTEPGTYKVKASWEGDLNTERAESIEETVTVETAQGFSLYYVIAGVGIIAVAAIILLYLLKIRKS